MTVPSPIFIHLYLFMYSQLACSRRNVEIARNIRIPSSTLEVHLTTQNFDVTMFELLFHRKKFFFSDQNVDRNDPVQLNQLYAQARDAIVDGTHPCAFDEAVNLAALQCQIVFGKHDPSKHKPGYLTEESDFPYRTFYD